MELRAAALRVLGEEDPAAKAAAARALLTLSEGWIDPQAPMQANAPLPGRPPRPLLVPPAALSKRSPFTLEGRAALLHAVTHIEFNAIK